MATKPNSTTRGASELPTWQVIAVLLAPAWIILATLAHGVVTGAVPL